MTTPSNTELREAIKGLLLEMRPEQVDRAADHLAELIQAREQQLLTELLGEAKEYEKWVGGNQATGRAITVEAVPVSVIQSKIGELNGA